MATHIIGAYLLYYYLFCRHIYSVVIQGCSGVNRMLGTAVGCHFQRVFRLKILGTDPFHGYQVSHPSVVGELATNLSGKIKIIFYSLNNYIILFIFIYLLTLFISCLLFIT